MLCDIFFLNKLESNRAKPCAYKMRLHLSPFITSNMCIDRESNDSDLEDVRRGDLGGLRTI